MARKMTPEEKRAMENAITDRINHIWLFNELSMVAMDAHYYEIPGLTDKEAERFEKLCDKALIAIRDELGEILLPKEDRR